MANTRVSFSELEGVWSISVCVCVCVCVCVFVSQRKKVPDEWQARQATPAINPSKQQQAQRKENYNKRKMCVFVWVCVCVNYSGVLYCIAFV